METKDGSSQTYYLCDLIVQYNRLKLKINKFRKANAYGMRIKNHPYNDLWSKLDYTAGIIDDIHQSRNKRKYTF